jgi:hypothetical protein
MAALLELTWWPPLVILLAIALAAFHLDGLLPDGRQLPDDLPAALRRWLTR